MEIKNLEVALFTAETALQDIPSYLNYAGGLGVLIGDALKTAADTSFPMIGVTNTYQNCLLQEVSNDGNQIENYAKYHPSHFKMEPLDKSVEVEIEGRNVKIFGWKYDIAGMNGFKVPLMLLDTDIEENREDGKINSHIYVDKPGSSNRLKQQIVLGIGGYKLLKKLGYNIKRYYLNEGHSALLLLELLKEYDYDVDKVRSMCSFTTHTPVISGHDVYSTELIKKILGDYIDWDFVSKFYRDGFLNTTRLALSLSGYSNAVSRRHAEIARRMFPEFRIDQLTNGVHLLTWTSEPFKNLYDNYMRGWRENPKILSSANELQNEEVWNAHKECKSKLIDHVNLNFGAGMSPEILTIGNARRSTGYKRQDLIFTNLERLLHIGTDKIQLIFSGKAHPDDVYGKELISKVCKIGEQIKDKIKFVYLPNYNLKTAALMVSGVDVWLNTPQKDLEACGTSGMKAACNGVLNFSVMEGWWIEAYNSKNGFVINSIKDSYEAVSNSLYDVLGSEIIPTFYDRREEWIKIMKNCIASITPYYNTLRMLEEYKSKTVQF